MKMVRIELHGLPDSQNAAIYQSLHDALEQARFVRTVIGNTGFEYELPTGLYRYSGTLSTAVAVRDEAGRVAKLVWPNKISVVATVGSASAWSGLVRVDELSDFDG